MKNLLKKTLLSILGINVLSSCGALYASPHADFEVKGRVSDKDGNPIQGIKVDLCEYNRQEDEYYTLLSDTVLTDKDGVFHIRETLINVGDKAILGFNDVDGEDNGGVFESKYMQVPVVQVSEGKWNDSWDEGDYAVPEEVEVTLYPKTDNGE